jgi:hypothetical protein
MMNDFDPGAARGLSPYVPFSGRDTLVWQRWDQGLGYRALHEAACARRPRRAVGDHGDLLDRRHALVPVVTPADADRVKALVFAADGTNRCDQLTLAEMADLFDLLFAGPLDDALAAVLQADYIPIFVGAGVTTPVGAAGEPENDLSNRWHCDGGPHNHLKLLLYLDDLDSHDGATMVVDRAVTDHFKRAGYAFDELHTRVSDLSVLAEALAIRPCPTLTCRPGKGEALLLEPANVLHRGYRPTFGARHVLTVGIVPFPFDRQSILPRAYATIRSNTEFDFPNMNGIG